jgi:aryl-alcohol dehydrogenase-like predicted oxidoreductase
MDHPLVLGTAQWGQAYGIANRIGQPTMRSVRQILAVAAAAGISTLDTARGYGSSEAQIGAATQGTTRWRIVTKLAPDVAGDDVPRAEAEARARESLKESRTALRQDDLDTVLLHRASHRTASQGGAWGVLRRERDTASIRQIGVSVTTIVEAHAAIDDPEVTVVQVPASLLDRRLLMTGFLAEAARRGVQVYVRSVFLQGAALLEPESLPPHLGVLRPILEKLDALAAAAETTRSQLLLSWARTRLAGSRIIIGCESPEQLEENLEAWAQAGRLEPLLRAIEPELPALPDDVLDPWRWPQTPTPTR